MSEDTSKEMRFTVIPDNGDEGVPFDDLMKGLQEAIDYANGKSPALVARYENGKCVSRQWQMADGIAVERPAGLSDTEGESEQ